jgi:hypothetical protein
MGLRPPKQGGTEEIEFGERIADFEERINQILKRKRTTTGEGHGQADHDKKYHY